MSIVPAFIRKKIAHRPNLVKIVDNIGWLFIDKVLRMGVGLIVGVWVARYLGPEQFGLLSFATAFVGLFGAIAGLGLQGIVVRDIIREPSCREETLGTAAMLHFIGGAAAYGLILATILWLRPDDILAKSLITILGSVMLFKASDVVVYWFESLVLSKHVVWVQNGSFLVFATIKVGLLLNNAPLKAFVWATMAEALMAALLLGVLFGLRGLRVNQLRISLARAKKLLNDSWPLLLSSIAIVIYMKIDQIMLGQMVDDNEVGIYNVAAKLSEIWYLIPTIIVSSVFPSLAKKHSTTIDEFYERLQSLYGYLVKISLVIAVLVSQFSEEIIQTIFGSNYMPAADVLKWHVWGGIFVFFGTAWSKWIVLEGLQVVAMKLHFMSLVSNILLNLILIPNYGAVGAAVATAISYGLGHSVYMVLFPSQKKMVKMFWRSFV